jgi:NDP-sugar pyrophosphorylase family protein
MLPLAILAGGLGTRLGLLTKNSPKCLIEINGRPFVDWQLDLLIKHGYTDFIFLISHNSVMVQEHLEDGRRWGVKIRYSLDGETQLGTGGAIQNALPLLGNAFGVIYGDSYLPIDYSEVERAFLSSSAEALMTVYENHNRIDSSNVELNEGILVNYKKGTNNPKMQHIDYGLTYFRSSAFSPLGRTRTFDLSDTCHQLSLGGKLAGYEVFERFYEVGSVQGVDECADYLRRVFG